MTVTAVAYAMGREGESTMNRAELLGAASREHRKAEEHAIDRRNRLLDNHLRARRLDEILRQEQRDRPIWVETWGVAVKTGVKLGRRRARARRVERRRAERERK